jgi:hypothetical protein
VEVVVVVVAAPDGGTMVVLAVGMLANKAVVHTIINLLMVDLVAHNQVVVLLEQVVILEVLWLEVPVAKAPVIHMVAQVAEAIMVAVAEDIVKAIPWQVVAEAVDTSTPALVFCSMEHILVANNTQHFIMTTIYPRPQTHIKIARDLGMVAI